jgi:CheY-like chemotaxis protein
MKNNDFDATGMTVLVVDDTPANIHVLRGVLEPEGLNISVAPNGEVALKISPQLLPDLILLDIMMPGIDGFETCQRFKEIEEVKSIPVIFISAKLDNEEIEKLFAVGGVDYINKPFRQEEVIARIKTHLQLKALKEKQN